MIVCLPVCAKDEHLAIANLEWCKKLDGQVDLKCVVSHDTSFDSSYILSLARSYFSEATDFCYDKWQGEQTWPHPQNWAWQSTARSMAKQSEVWLWWEADAVPLRKGCFQALQEAKKKCPKPFLGCLMSEYDGHMNGVGIYPHDVHSYSINGLLCRSRPFDVVMRPEIGSYTAHTDLIQHVISDHGSSFYSKYDVSNLINEKAVLFHRCKDGSLIKVLEDSNSWSSVVSNIFKAPAKPKITIVITNFKRPQFLRTAFDSATKCGNHPIVVSSSAADQEILDLHKQFRKSWNKVKTISEKGDSGCNANWLAGVKAAKTEWVNILHDDDLLLPDFKIIDDEIEDDVGFLIWDARRHGMGFTDYYKSLERPGGIYPTKDLLRNLMIKGSFTFSPVIGCFRKADLIETLVEARAQFKQGFHLKPTMMVGNDLLIWLNAIKKYRYFKYIDRALSSFGHHPGSTTCDDVFNKRGMLAGIYDLTRSYFIKSHPRIIHVVSRYNPSDPKTRSRVEFAAKSWNTLYATGLVEPVHVWNTDRDSMGLGDQRRTHFLKDVLRVGMGKARDFDYIMFTNDDSVLHPDLPYYLFDFMLDTDCCCAFRRAYSPGTFPPLHHRPKHPQETPGHDPGRDFFCFSKKWLIDHWDDIPDYLLGATDFDSTLGTLIRITKNIPVSDKTWLTHDPRCEIPSWFVFHENHEATWSSAHNRKFGPANVYNRRLTYEFIKKHDNGWFVDFGRSGICETFTSNNLIPLIAHLDPSSGYGITAVELTSALIDLGYTVDLYQGSKWNEFDKLPDKVRGCLQRGAKVPSWNFVMYPCVFQPDFLDMNMDNRTAWFSMWETTSISREGMDTGGTMIRGVSFLNRCVVAIVPCRWNAQVFQSSGVAVPIRVCPLGIDLEAFPLIENDPNQTLVFGSAARVSVGGIRKGLGIVTQAFKVAFPTEQDVRLRVKCFPDDIFDTPTDPRIDLSAKVFTKPELIDWYRSINVFVSGSASEGWGRHQQESMSMGRPIISINCGGVTEFFSEENGYPINHTTVTAEGVYTGMGYYFRPEVASMAAQMRRAYEDRKEIVSKGLLASKSARKFSIEHSAKTLVSIFKEFKLI